MKKNSNLKIIIFYIVLFAAVILALSFMFNQNSEEKVTYSQIVDYFKKDMVAEFVVDDDFYIEMKVYNVDADGNVLTSGETKTIGYQLQSLGLFVEDCSEYYKGNQNLKSYDIEPETVFPLTTTLIYLAVLFVTNFIKSLQYIVVTGSFRRFSRLRGDAFCCASRCAIPATWARSYAPRLPLASIG